MMRNQEVASYTLKQTCFLWTLFVLSAIGYCVDSNNIVVQSCKITAGNYLTADSIAITGKLTGSDPDFAWADQVVVTLGSDILSTPPTFEFPIDEKTYKNNSFKSVKSIKIFSQLFQYNLKTRKFSFTAKTNLTGFSCPFGMTIQIGNYTAQGLLTEAVVNGAKLCPFQLLMGVQNSLEVTKKNFKLGETPGTDTLSIDGLFTVGAEVDPAQPFVLILGSEMLGSQTFTVNGSAFTNRSDVYTCTNAPVAEGGIASVKLDMVRCQFTIKIKNTTLIEHGTVNLDMAILGNSILGLEQIDLGRKTIFTYDELMRQTVEGSYWNYDGRYADNIDGEKSSGPIDFQLSVQDVNELNEGQECTVVYTSMISEDYFMVSYTDQDATHGYEWGMVDDEGLGFDVFFDAPQILYPSFLRLPYSCQSTGTFVGYFDFGDAQTSDWIGNTKTAWKLIGYENVTVGAGVFTNVLKSRQDMSFSGQMHVLIDDGSVYYDKDIRITLASANIYWSDLTAGIVKTDQTITLTMVLPGVGTFKSITNTNGGLTEYLIPEDSE